MPVVTPRTMVSDTLVAIGGMCWHALKGPNQG